MTATEITLVTVSLPCNCCGSNSERKVLEKRGTVTGHPFQLVQCRRCGFLYFNPRPSQEMIANLYDEKYYAGKGWDPATNYTSAYGHDEIGDNRMLLNRLISFHKPPARLLDFGCGLGDLARQARAAGYDVEGYEISPSARAFCQQNGLTVYAETSKIPNNSYDIVTAVEVIEHAYTPDTLFKQVQTALRPGGVFLYTTMNPTIFLWKYWLGLVSDDSYILPEGHLNFFNRHVMKRYLRAAGFSRFGQQWVPSATPLRSFIKDLLGLHLPSGIK